MHKSKIKQFWRHTGVFSLNQHYQGCSLGGATVSALLFETSKGGASVKLTMEAVCIPSPTFCEIYIRGTITPLTGVPLGRLRPLRTAAGFLPCGSGRRAIL